MQMIFGDPRSLTQEEIEERKHSLRNGVFTLGIWRGVLILFHVGLYCLIRPKGDSQKSNTLQLMALGGIPLISLTILVLILGALKRRTGILDAGALLCLIMALYDTVFGAMGFYFFRAGYLQRATGLVFLLGFMTLSIIFVWYDIFLIKAYVKLLRM